MTIEYRTDSDGNGFQVWAQRQENSCAVACLWMAECQAKQMTVAEGEWEKAWKLYEHTVNNTPWTQSSSARAPTGPMSIDPSAHASDQTTFYNMFSNFGTFAGQVATVLRREGLTVAPFSASSSTTPPQMSLATNRITTSTPAVVLLGWYNRGRAGWRRTGGHFIVAARVNSRGQIVYLDPWGGVLNESPNNGRYQRNGYIEVALYVSGGM